MDELNFRFKMPDDETLAEYISIKGEKGEKGDPTKLSQLDNDTGFVTASTDALTNYYTKTQTDTALNGKVDNSTLEAIEIPDGFFTGDETITDSGTFIELSNTAEAVLKNVELYGDSKQNGTPAPDSPVAIQVVTGEQPIIITDNGEQSQSYTLSMGELELCKLGDYQDFIYKGNDGWYKHCEIGKVILDGSETWGKSASTANHLYIHEIPEMVKDNSTLVFPILADRFTYQNRSDIYARSIVGITTQTTGGGVSAIRIGMGIDSDVNTTVLFKAWLSQNNTVLYYPLAESVELQITDAKLIEQLNALAAANSYNDVTVIACSGSLPVIMSVEAFGDNWSGTIAGITSTNAVQDKVIKKAFDNLRSSSYMKAFFPNLINCGDLIAVKFMTDGAEKNAIFDFGRVADGEYPSLAEKIHAAGFDKFDYAFISHYHNDHVGYLPLLLEDDSFDFSECVFYLPPTPDYSQFVGSARYIPEKEAEIKALLTEKNIDYVIPNNGTVINVGNDAKIRFFNCDTSEFVNYYDELEENSDTPSQMVTIYNNFSMVNEIEFKGQRMLITGDIQQAAQEVIVEQGVRRPDILKIEHHGVNKTIYESYMNIVHRPEVALAMFGTDKPSVRYDTIERLSISARTYINSVSGDVTLICDGFGNIIDDSENGIYRSIDEIILGDMTDLRKLASGTDLNDIKNIGTYWAEAGALTNAPTSGSSHAIRLIVMKTTNADRGLQFVLENATSCVYCRNWSDDTWSPWFTCFAGGNNAQLAQNSDLDSINHGAWFSNNSTATATMSNVPSDVTAGFRITTYQTISSERLTQELVPNSSDPVFYRRIKTSSGWSQWYRFAPYDYSPKPIKIASNSDANNLLNGMYAAESAAVAATIANIPTAAQSSAFKLTTERASTVDDRYFQKIITLSATPRIFIRSKTSGGWQSWTEIQTA